MSSPAFETAPRIICEQGDASRLGQGVTEIGVKRLFMVTDEGSVKAGLTACRERNAASLAVSHGVDLVRGPRLPPIQIPSTTP